MRKEILGKSLKILFSVSLAVLILTFSIGLPIYVRPFYYLQIDDLDIPERTGYTYEEIKSSFDELMDYLTLPGREFGIGVFPYSESGKAHFVDCRALFNLNLILLIISLSSVISLTVLDKKHIIELNEKKKMHLSYYVATTMLIIIAIVGVLASINFKTAFDIFHKIFFSGKSNWYFDYNYDPIILALPRKFFSNCAVLILTSVIVLCIANIIFNIIMKKKAKKA